MHITASGTPLYDTSAKTFSMYGWNRSEYILPKRDPDVDSCSVNVLCLVNGACVEGYYYYRDEEWLLYSVTDDIFDVFDGIVTDWMYINYPIGYKSTQVIDGE